MSNDYSWRDGWALEYPHPLPQRTKIKSKPENVYRCPCVGVLVYLGNACPICNKKKEKGNE